MRLRLLIPTLIPALLFYSCQSPGSDYHFELVIQGGNVLDGDGYSPFVADIGINKDTITYIGRISEDQADSIIDASGLEVAPGFIDLHTHLNTLMEIPDATSHLMQGATTALGGPDGGGPWPFGEYLDSLDKMDLGMNVAFQVGHNTIRRTVMGLDNRSPEDEELVEMKSFVAQAMEEGAYGISTGLKYLPGAFSEIEEVIELSKVAAEYGGIYTSHLREEGLGLLEGVQEAIVIGAEADIPIVLTHHKAIGKPMWGSSVKTLAMIDSARNAGIDVMADQYPYTASYTSLSILIPAWAMAGGQEEFEKRVNNPVLKDSILIGTEFNIINDRAGDDLRRVQFSRTPWDSTLSGKTLHDWAIKRGLESNARNGAELVLEAQMSGGGTAIYHAINDEDVRRIMKHPMTMIASDGRLNNMGEGWPHPRWYGTFPKVLGHYTREEGVLDLPTAIKKMTSMPADRLGLDSRGRLRAGNIADIVIFEADSIADMASFEDPHHHPKGIHYVIVNGALTVFRGEMQGTRNGRVLRGPGFVE